MNCKIFLAVVFLLLFLGSASAVYELCDSIERDNNGSIFRCNITTPKMAFTQQDIDAFWQNILLDGGFTSGRMKTVEWKIMQTVIQYSDDVRFVQAPEMDLNWDIVLEGGSTASLDINTAASAIADRPGNQTAIKMRVDSIGATREYLLSIAPLGNRKSVRNISLTLPSDGLAVYISGSTIDKAEMEIEGSLIVSGAYVENIKGLKAKGINIGRKGSIREVESIKVDSILLNGESYIRGVGAFSTPAIVVEGPNGLTLQGASLIEDVKGGIEVTENISITENSRLENLSILESESIQWIYAKNITLNQGKIRGFGGQPGEIFLSGNLSMDQSQIVGKESYKPTRLEALGILLANKSTIQYFTEKIKVTGKALFSLEGGSMIKNFSGEIESCSPLKMDGNTTRLVLDSEGTKKVGARAIELTGDAEITCTGQDECEYNFVQMECGAVPTVTLNVNGESIGDAPFIVSLVGSCDGHGVEVTCVIDFGDGSDEEDFYGNLTHIYRRTGEYIARLTATNETGQTAKAEKLIVVMEGGVAPPSVPAVQMSLSKQTAKKGEEISINIACNTDFNTFKVENNLGLPLIETVPQRCPVSFGPFKIPDGLEPGTYSFNVMGTTAGGRAFNQTAMFTVEAETSLIPGLDLEEMLPYAAGILIAACIIALLVLKKKGIILKPKAKKPPKAGQGQKASPVPEKGPQKKKEAASATPWMESSEGRGEKPPWLMEGGAILSSEPRQPQPKKAEPAAQKLAGQQQPTGTAQKAKPEWPGTAQPAPAPGEKGSQIDNLISELESIEQSKAAKGLRKQATAPRLATQQPAMQPMAKQGRKPEMQSMAKPATGQGPQPTVRAAEPEIQAGKKLFAPNKIVIPPTPPKKKRFKIPGFGLFKRKKKEPLQARQTKAIKGAKPAKAAENLFGKPKPEKKSRFGWLKRKKKPTAAEKLFGKEMPTRATPPPAKPTAQPKPAQKPKPVQVPKPSQQPKPIAQPKPIKMPTPVQQPKKAQPPKTIKAATAIPQAKPAQPKPAQEPKSRFGWLKRKKPGPKPAKKAPSSVPSWLKKIEEEDK
jgi:PKD repeat protein